ncbi:5-dehydro-4-deoxyglucarate dehydratase [uncultured Arcticibacterium sp.]|uniref:5-dehydro-4-deoxyglucarate dehydratase n=1 Tax=uncultured Arcticibacterium sp. TaxID=2173042 RepID=UPI0030FA7548
MNLQKIIDALGNGLLSFPITDMDSAGNFDQKSYENRLEWFSSKEISSVFVAGGTGEFFSLSKEEYGQIIHSAAKIVGERLPVISSVGRSIPESIEFAKMAEEAGIHALLLMPPYLTGCPKDGLVKYAETIMNSTSLPVIYYNRGNGILSAPEIKELADKCENFVGLKDGTGNMQELNEIIKTVGDRLVYIGGVPTAEIISEAYLAIGVNTYSSAVFNFVPDMAICFYKALRAGEKEIVTQIIKEFFIPFVNLRSKKSGYAVSLIKEGAILIDQSAGDVRAPLVMPNAEESKILEGLISKANELAKR